MANDAIIGTLIVKLQRDINEAIVTLADVIEQACGSREGEIDSCAISTYADAIDLLDRYGLIRWVMPPMGKRRVARINQEKLRELMEALRNENN